MTADTIIVHDRRLGRTFFGGTRAEVLSQFTQVSVVRRGDGGWRVEVKVVGFSVPVTLGYRSEFTPGEVERESSVAALNAISRNYGSRYSVFLAAPLNP